jgi:excisionase family DNA binding protein
VFDRSAAAAEHPQNTLAAALGGVSPHLPASGRLFGRPPTERHAYGYAARPVRATARRTNAVTPDDPHPPLALRPRDAARRLGVSPRTLWEWTRAGLVPCVRVGTGSRKTVLYPVADLQAWLARRAANGGAE